MKVIRIILDIFLSLFVLTFLIFILYTFCFAKEECLVKGKRLLFEKKPILKTRQVEINKYLVKAYLNHNSNIKFPSLVFTQIMKETGLTARWVKENNNITCMRMPKKRKTTALGDRNGYAYYSSWQSCIDDYALYQEMYTGKTKEGYLEFLRKYKYSTDSSYVDSLKVYDSRISNNKRVNN